MDLFGDKVANVSPWHPIIAIQNGCHSDGKVLILSSVFIFYYKFMKSVFYICLHTSLLWEPFIL